MCVWKWKQKISEKVKPVQSPVHCPFHKLFHIVNSHWLVPSSRPKLYAWVAIHPVREEWLVAVLFIQQLHIILSLTDYLHLLEGEYSMVMPKSSMAAPSKVRLFTLSALVSSSSASSLKIDAFSAATWWTHIKTCLTWERKKSFDFFYLPLEASATHLPYQGQHWPSPPDLIAPATKDDRQPPCCNPLRSLTRWRAGRRSSRPPAAQDCTSSQCRCSPSPCQTPRRRTATWGRQWRGEGPQGAHPAMSSPRRLRAPRRVAWLFGRGGNLGEVGQGRDLQASPHNNLERRVLCLFRKSL